MFIDNSELETPLLTRIGYFELKILVDETVFVGFGCSLYVGRDNLGFRKKAK